MDPLKDFIDNNRALFDSEGPSSAAEEQLFGRLNPPWRTWMTYTSIAASVAVLIGVGAYFLRQPAQVSPCVNQTHTCYIVEMQRLSGQITRSAQGLSEPRRQEVLQTLASLVPHEDDFERTLPEELTPAQQEDLLTAYYAQLFEGVKAVAALADESR